MPKPFVWNGGSDGGRLLANGVYEGYLARVERDTAIGVAPLGSVLQVALYRATDSRHLAAYLVVASGLQLHLDERVSVAFGQGAVP